MPDSNAVFGKRNAQEHSARTERTSDAYSAITQAARAAAAAASLAGDWLLYRKQNVGLAFVAAYFLLGVVGSSLKVYAITINIACVVFLGLFGKSMVINGALQSIARIRAVHAGRHGHLRIGIAGDPSWLLPLMALILVINISFSIEPRTHVENVATPSVEESH